MKKIHDWELCYRWILNEKCCLHRLAWYAEKKAVEAHKIVEEDSSEQSYFIYAITLTVITVGNIVISIINFIFAPFTIILKCVEILFKKDILKIAFSIKFLLILKFQLVNLLNLDKYHLFLFSQSLKIYITHNILSMMTKKRYLWDTCTLKNIFSYKFKILFWKNSK